MTVSILVPRSPGTCPHRDRAWTWIRQRIEHLGEVIEGTTTGTWSKGRAIADAAARAHGDILVIHDADSTVDTLHTAISAVAAGAPWAVPHSRIHRLHERETATWLAGPPPTVLPSITARQRERTAYASVYGGGITVVHRDVMCDVPIDPRFEGWGGEDLAWGRALRTLHGEPPQCGGGLVHLWHPKAPTHRKVNGPLDATEELAGRYARADGRPDEMRALLDELPAR